METDRPDVLVVGLGPAGSCAAAAAAAAGFGVIALERRPAPGRPVQCAEFVPALLDQEVATLDRVTEQTIERMLTFVEDSEAEEMPLFPGRMLDRGAFDRMLAEDAARAGAVCRYGVSVFHIAGDGAVRTSDNHIFHPRLVIGADGPRSRVGAAIGRVNCAMVETRQVTVPLLQRHDATDIFIRADYVGGYGWLFPKGASANLGLGLAAERRPLLKELLDSLRERLRAEGRIGGTTTSLTGGAIPVGGRVSSTGAIAAMPVLLAGDAAGLTNPVTGAGIAAAVQSGKLAGRAAADWLAGRAAAVDDYEEELADIFDGALARAAKRRRELLDCYRNGGWPSTAALRAGWIAYPEYWAA